MLQLPAIAIDMLVGQSPVTGHPGIYDLYVATGFPVVDYHEYDVGHRVTFNSGRAVKQVVGQPDIIIAFVYLVADQTYANKHCDKRCQNQVCTSPHIE